MSYWVSLIKAEFRKTRGDARFQALSRDSAVQMAANQYQESAQGARGHVHNNIDLLESPTARFYELKLSISVGLIYLKLF